MQFPEDFLQPDPSISLRFTQGSYDSAGPMSDTGLLSVVEASCVCFALYGPFDFASLHSGIL